MPYPDESLRTPACIDGVTASAVVRAPAMLRKRCSAATLSGIGAPRRTVARVPSSNTQSSAITHRRVGPYLSECAPDALVDTIPPTVQNAPLDGSGGKRRPALRAAVSTSCHVIPGPTEIVRFATSTADMPRMRLRSTITPSPMAPPAIPLPDP